MGTVTDNRGVVQLTGRPAARRNLLVLCAAALALVLVGVSWLVVVNRVVGLANPFRRVALGTPTPSLTPATSAPDTSQVAGDHPGEPIPWQVVEAGWSVTLSVDPASAGSKNALLLVSPWGARYTVGAYTASALMDVSRDGSRALLASPSGPLVVDMTTGNAQVVGDSRSYPWSATLVEPDGSGLFLLKFDQGSPNLLERWGAASTTPTLSVGTDVVSVEMSPDGRYTVGFRNAESDSVVVLDDKSGEVVATVPTPDGAAACTPANWWSDDQLVVTCQVGSSVFDVWGYSLSARTMTRISRGSSSYTVAYASSVGVIVQHAVGCDSPPLGILSQDGTGDTPLPTPGLNDAGSLVAVVGNTAYLNYAGCHDNTGHNSYVAYDLETHTSVTLLDATSQAIQGWITLS